MTLDGKIQEIRSLPYPIILCIIIEGNAVKEVAVNVSNYERKSSRRRNGQCMVSLY